MPARRRQARRRSSKAAAAPRSRRVPPAARRLARGPHVVLLGVSPLAKRVARAVRQVGVQCRTVRSPDEAEATMDERSKALVVVPPIPKFSVLRFARRRQKTDGKSEAPFFVVMDGSLPNPTTRKLYGAGVEAVFEWPSDSQAVKRTMLRLTSTEVLALRRPKSASEIALEEVARAHLRVDAVPFGAELGVEARDHCLMLRGAIDSLWKLDLARQVVSEIPGVDDVVADGVEVTGQARRDQDVARSIRQVLRNAASIQSETLVVSVRSGEVTLAGSVRDTEESRRILELVRQVDGVRRTHDFLLVSKRAKQKDRAVAQRIRKTLRTRFTRLPLQLSVFGGVAVLAGRVPNASLRDRVKRLVEGQRGVERVVDKTRVGPRRRRG